MNTYGKSAAPCRSPPDVADHKLFPMFTLTRLLSWRYLRRHMLRLLLATFSIALGVATLVATQLLNRSTWAAVETTSVQLAGFADLQVTNGAQGVPVELLPKVRGVPGVRAAVPLLVRRVDVQVSERVKVKALVMGVDPRDEQQFRSYGSSALDVHLKANPGLALNPEFLLNPTPVVAIGENLQQDLPADAQSLEALISGNLRRLWIGGTLHFGEAGELFGGRVIVMPLDQALELFSRKNKASRFDIRLADGADKEQVIRDIEAILAGQAQIHPPRFRDTNLEDVLGGIQGGLTLGATVALFVGMFLVYNTLSVTVAERRHDIGILRSLGATRGQIRELFAIEALTFGAIGSALGVVGGLGLAYFSMETVSRVLQEQFAAIDLRKLEITPDLIILGMAAGMVVALIAALAPAAAAAAEPPSDSLRRVPAQLNPLRAWGPLLAAGVTAVVAFMIFQFRDRFPPRWASYANIYLLGLAFMLATPWLARVGIWLLRPLAQWLGTGMRLAADDLARSPSRTGLTVGALALGLALTVETSGLITSTEKPVFEWLTRAIHADLLVTSGSAITGGGDHSLMDESLGQELAAHPQVQDVLPIRLAPVDFRNTRVLICAVPFHLYGKYNEDNVTSGADRAGDRMSRTDAREVIISDNFAAQHNVRVGDEIELPTAKGRARWRVAATIVDYSWNRGTVFFDREPYKEWFDDPLVDSFDLYLKPGADAEAVRRDLQKTLGREHMLVILTNAEFQGHIKQMMERFYTLVYANGCMSLVVAFLGVANTLAISVLQRRRELGLLRAVGATRLQIAGSVAAQAFLIGILGLALGLGLGALLQEYVLKVLFIEETGFVFAFLFPVTMALLATAFTVAGAQVAAALPALRAAHLPVSEAVAYE
jgi:putative ABC transport system permease protein